MIRLKRTPRSKGYALATILVLLGVSMFAGAAAVSVSTLESRISLSQQGGVAAYYVAEGGVQEAIWRINNTSTYSNAVANGTLNVTYTVNNQPVAGSGYTATLKTASNGKGYATVDVTGSVDNGIFVAKRRVVATLFQGVNNPGNGFSIIAGGRFNFNHNGVTFNVNGGNFYLGGDFRMSGGSVNMGNGTINTIGDYNTSGATVNNLGAVNANSCNPTPASGCGPAPTNIVPPSFDFNCANYTGVTSYTPAQFKARIEAGQSFPGPVTCLNGSVPTGSWLKNKNVNINGMLIVKGAFPVNASGVNVSVTDTGNTGKAGIFIQQDFTPEKGNWNITGVLYAGSGMQLNNDQNFNINGSIVSGGEVSSNTGVHINLTYVPIYGQNTLGGGTKALSVQYWEEEY